MEELQLKDYQMNCLEKAKHQNLLVVLPPQMGKTLLACQLAEWYRGQDQLVAYTAPSVELCNQAARCLARQLPQAAVATVTGECRWEKEEWNKGCNGNDVLIATPECFRQALQSSWLNPGDIALFIFDECHHATGKSPMGIILKEHLHPSSHPPRLLALTSCPFPSSRKRGRPGGNGAGHAAAAALVELEEIFRAELCWPQVANDAEEMIESPLQSKSWEKVHWDVDDYDASAVTQLLRSHWQSLSHVLGIGAQARDFRSMVDRMQKVLQQLGRDGLLHYIDHCCATQIREALDKNLKFEEKDKERALCDNMDMVEHRLKELVPLIKESAQNLPRVSGKALMLHHLLEGLGTERAVIFVKDAAVTLPLAAGIVENVGVMAEAYYAQRRDCAKILDDFRSGTLQVLVSTDALEEGLVLDCSWVVRFDHFTSTCSHVAGSGRGSSRILYFCNDPSAEMRRASELRSDAARIDAERDVRGKRQRLEVHVPEVKFAGSTGSIAPLDVDAKHYECQVDEKLMEIEQLELPGFARPTSMNCPHLPNVTCRSTTLAAAGHGDQEAKPFVTFAQEKHQLQEPPAGAHSETSPSHSYQRAGQILLSTGHWPGGLACCSGGPGGRDEAGAAGRAVPKPKGSRAGSGRKGLGAAADGSGRPCRMLKMAEESEDGWLMSWRLVVF